VHSFAVLTVYATFVLIFVGGLVTSTGSALAVPDWPLAFGKLIPAWEGGVRFEYGHRVVAGGVVIVMAALMVQMIRFENRRWVRNVAIAAFGLIIVQAILGGITVLLEIPLAIAIAHSATAQAFFCLTVAMAVFTSNWFASAPHLDEPHDRPSLAVLTGLTTALIYIQILVGALVRHLGAGLSIPDFPLSFGRLIPPTWDIYIAANFAHRCGAVVVTCFIVWTCVHVMRSYSDRRELLRPARALLGLLILQLTLGAITIWTEREVIPTTAHVAIGAAVLATALMLTIRTWRLYGAKAHESALDRSARNAGDVLQPGATA